MTPQEGWIIVGIDALILGICATIYVVVTHKGLRDEPKEKEDETKYGKDEKQ